LTVTAGLVAVLFVAAALAATGVLVIAWRRDVIASIAGIPLLFGGAGIAFVGVARFSARATAAAVQTPTRGVVVSVSGPPLGQEAAVLIAVAALAFVALAIALAGRVERAQGGPGAGPTQGGPRSARRQAGRAQGAREETSH
jgi:NADH:ubiquinone oxidoreductase subunit K